MPDPDEFLDYPDWTDEQIARMPVFSLAKQRIIYPTETGDTVMADWAPLRYVKGRIVQSRQFEMFGQGGR